jgi:hypothetical protein
MGFKGTIQEDHLPKNLFLLTVPGAPPITFTKVSGLEEELEVVDLPDRTKASGGQKKALEFTVRVPEHHTQQIQFMDLWYKQGQQPVVPGYKKASTLSRPSLASIPRSYSLTGCFVMKRKTDDLEMSDEGGMSEVEYTISCDEVLPI